MTIDSVMGEVNQIIGNTIVKKSISFTNYQEYVWATESEFE